MRMLARKSGLKVAALGREEVGAMLAEDGGAVITCGFCNETYRLGKEALAKILAREQV